MLLAVPLVLFACSGRVRTEAVGTTDAGSSTCAADACAGQPIPKHQCVGGVPASKCNARADGTCRWQIDCVTPDPNAPPDMRGVSSCQPGACGAEPAWNADECVYGFVSPKPSCENLDRAGCAWSRRCGPRPCSETGTCNTLDRSRLGKTCDAESGCPDGTQCVSFSVNIGDYVEPTCVQGNPCAALTCATGKSCVVLESYPGQVMCAAE